MVPCHRPWPDRIVAWAYRILALAVVSSRAPALCRGRVPRAGMALWQPRSGHSAQLPSSLLVTIHSVYCDLMPQPLKPLPVTIHSHVLRHNFQPSQPSACHDSTKCIVTRSSSPSLSCYDTTGCIVTRSPCNPTAPCCNTILIPLHTKT